MNNIHTHTHIYLHISGKANSLLFENLTELNVASSHFIDSGLVNQYSLGKIYIYVYLCYVRWRLETISNHQRTLTCLILSSKGRRTKDEAWTWQVYRSLCRPVFTGLDKIKHVSGNDGYFITKRKVTRLQQVCTFLSKKSNAETLMVCLQ